MFPFYCENVLIVGITAGHKKLAKKNKPILNRYKTQNHVLSITMFQVQPTLVENPKSSFRRNVPERVIS